MLLLCEIGTADLKAELRDLYISAAKQVDIEGGKKAIILWVPFKLGKGDALTITRLDDGETVETLDWDSGDAPEGTTWGPLTDGEGAPQRLSPTPGEANAAFDGTLPLEDPYATHRADA